MKEIMQLSCGGKHKRWGIMHQIKDISMKTLLHDFSSGVDEHPRKALIRIAINNGKFRSYKKFQNRNMVKLCNKVLRALKKEEVK